MNIDTATLWTIILSLGVGTFLIRFSFLGLIGNRDLPPWVLRHLRYVAVAVMPALITPLVIWPEATHGETDPSRLSAALVAFVVGVRFNSVVSAVVSGMTTLYAMQYFFS